MQNDKKDVTDVKSVLAQWQTCIEMANATSQRRDMMNNIFVTLNLGILSTVSFAWSPKFILLLCAGTIICGLWLCFIRNFKLLNSAKFEVIDSLERELPTAPFRDEWEILQKTKKYYDGTKLERIIPITFICIYVIVAVVIKLVH